MEKIRVADAVPLSRYAYLIGYRETAFWGINHPDNLLFACREIWTEDQRMMVRDALQQAQDMLEQELRYPLSYAAIEDDRTLFEPLPLTELGHVVSLGEFSQTLISAEAVVTTSDPATIGPVVVGTYPTTNLVLKHVGTDSIIEPSLVQSGILGVTFTVPFERLVAPAFRANPPTGWDYSDFATWIATDVEVWGWNLDASRAVSAWKRSSSGACAEVETTLSARLVIPKIGRVEICHCSDPCYTSEEILIRYLARRNLGTGAEAAIVRLAHSLMPDEPCGCTLARLLWERDRKENDVLTRERLNCPFGLSNGAWFAWRWAQFNRLVRGGRSL